LQKALAIGNSGGTVECRTGGHGRAVWEKEDYHTEVRHEDEAAMQILTAGKLRLRER